MLDIKKLEESDQFIHCSVTRLPSNQLCFFTFIYARNPRLQRLVLWEDIKRIGSSISLPWCAIGDYNNVLSADERRGGEQVHPRETVHFMDCLLCTGLVDHKASGFFFTWSNNSQGPARIQSRIDRCLVNSWWSASFDDTGVEFLPHGVSDHSPIVVSWYSFTKKASSFRYSNAWAKIPGFFDVVNVAWQTDIHTDPMNLLVRKLKILKSRLIEWAKNNCSLLHKRVEEARKELFNIQKALHDNPLSVGLVVREKQILNKYGNLARAEMVSLKMKASCDWLCFGDRGTTYFHNAIKEKRSRNAI
ncbi:Ribonuclease h domain, partial [Thalictrum thalictroides]